MVEAKLDAKDGGKRLQDFGHEALIGSESEGNKPFSEFDFDRGRGAYQNNHKAGMDLNVKFQTQKTRLLGELPFAKIKPKKHVPSRKVYDGIQKLQRQKTMMFSADKTLTNTLLKKLKKNKKAKKQKVLSKEDDDFLQSRGRRMRYVASTISNHTSELYSLLLVMRENSDKVDDVRVSFNAIFYGGSTITGVSMGSVASSEMNFIRNPDPKKPRHNLPPTSLIEKLAAELGFSGVDELEREARKGAQLKTFKEIQYGNRVKSNRSGDLTDVYERLETKRAKKLLEYFEEGEEEELLSVGSFEDISVDDSEDENFIRAEAEKLQDVLDQDDGRFKSTPFLYGKVYTYKLLYYAYLNYFGYILPFGKTLPSLGWMLVFSYYIDPENSLGLRLNMTNFVLKVGGLPLLEKTSLIGDSELESLRLLYKPTLTSEGSGTARRALTSTLLNTIRTRNIHLKQCELIDSMNSLKEDLSECMTRYHSILEHSDLAKEPLYTLDADSLQDNVNLALSDNSTVYHDIMRKLLVKHDVEYISDIPDPSLYYQNFVPLMVDTAALVVKYAKMWKAEKPLGRQWFIFNLMHDCGDIEKSSFARFRLMCKTSGYTDSVKILIAPSEAIDEIRDCFDKAEKLVNEKTVAELKSILASSNFKADVVRKEWVVLEARSILKEDPELARLIPESMARRESWVEDQKESSQKDASQEVARSSKSKKNKKQNFSAYGSEGRRASYLERAISNDSLELSDSAYRDDVGLYELRDDTCPKSVADGACPKSTVETHLKKRAKLESTRPALSLAYSKSELPTLNILQLHEQAESIGKRAFKYIYSHAIDALKEQGYQYMKELFVHACVGAATHGIITNSYATKLKKKAGSYLYDSAVELSERLGKPSTPIQKTIKAILGLITGS